MDNHILENEELAKQLRDATDMTEVVSILKGVGIDMTEETLLSKLDASEGELTEENLEEVVGGANFILYNPLITYTLRKVILDMIKKGKLRPGALGSFVGGGSR